MKKFAWLLLAGLLLLLPACADAPQTGTAAGTAEESPSLGGPETLPAPETPDLTGREEVLFFYGEEGTLEDPSAVFTAALGSPEDLEPFAAYFSASDLAAAKALIEKGGSTVLLESYLNDPLLEFHLQSVSLEADHVTVMCTLERPSDEGAEAAAPHGDRLFAVIHLDEAWAKGLPLQVTLSAD